MGKIGAKIQEARLLKGLTLDRVADDTNIGVRFLTKIENDDFTGFPGTPYVIGFVRNYAEYLGLDAEGIISILRSPDAAVEGTGAESAAPGKAAAPAAADGSMSAGGAGDGTSRSRHKDSAPGAARSASSNGSDKAGAAENESSGSSRSAQEGPSASSAGEVSGGAGAARLEESFPADGIIQKRGIVAETTSPSFKTPRYRLRGIVLGGIAVAIVAVAVLWIAVGNRLSSKPGESSARQPAEYRVEGTAFEKRLYVGDSLLVAAGDDVYKVTVSSIAESVVLETPFESQTLSLGASGMLFPAGQGSQEIRFTVEDFEKKKAQAGALIKVEIADAAPEQAGDEITVPESPVLTAKAPLQGDLTILKSSRGPYPVIVQASFRANCLFRYEADKKEWVERYYSKGETVSVNVSSSLTIWASNAQAAKIVIQVGAGKSYDLEIGSPGEIVVKRIAWTKGEGIWSLVASDMD